MRESRRRFLAQMARTLVLAAFFPWLAKRPEGIAARPAAGQLTKLLNARDSARVVGLEYLKAVPAERNVKLLLERICPDWFDLRTFDSDSHMKMWRELMTERKRQDFQEGRVVRIRGWILSETEARLSALAALL